MTDTGLFEFAAVWPLWQGALLPLLALAWPLLIGALAALPPLREHAIRLLPLAPLPALWLALVPPDEAVTRVPALLLGVQLELDATGRVLLGMAAALWLAAGVYAAAYMTTPRKPAIFSGFWCLTLAGNLGVFLAADAVTFYVAFAAVSLASYFLVVHDGTREALRASRVYIVLAILGEAMLLIGFVLVVAGADATAIPAMRDALAGDSMAPALRTLAIGLLIAGFGIKAGLMPLHVWLPLAHPAAPTPASAVLSGAIVKAGLIGVMRFLPEGDAITGGVLIALGLTGAYLAVLLGLGQARIKAVLAYSTVSQMGLLTATVGAGLLADRSGAIQSATFYALHHGFAKGALFLAVGLLPLTRGASRWLLLAFVALVAASIAGLPGTGGALAKAAIKPAFDDPIQLIVGLSSITTALILARYLFLAARTEARDDDGGAPLAMTIPVVACGLAALVLPWLLWSDHDPRSLAYLLKPVSIWTALWPVLVGAALAVGIGRLVTARNPKRPDVPEGDLVVPLERLVERLVEAFHRRPSIGPDRIPAWQARRIRRLSAALEGVLERWPVAGILLIGVLVVVAIGAAL
ncbi:NADH dehydrogenase [Wenzhouxiangella sp. XN79A]|uniref:complex I subunit 5 family protein n=1 Tax=Wenzhouxiangella sp. XN79A TaxID=2724193 RepID=UPI00144AD8A8|nr:complex I subunit 5 family protein [Wenzhouxiangella sp. XN79A]NKI35608.1 NADH dehydrogenase [Wenzhouxiangella sp. XN79A]